MFGYLYVIYVHRPGFRGSVGANRPKVSYQRLYSGLQILEHTRKYPTWPIFFVDSELVFRVVWATRNHKLRTVACNLGQRAQQLGIPTKLNQYSKLACNFDQGHPNSDQARLRGLSYGSPSNQAAESIRFLFEDDIGFFLWTRHVWIQKTRSRRSFEQVFICWWCFEMLIVHLLRESLEPRTLFISHFWRMWREWFSWYMCIKFREGIPRVLSLQAYCEVLYMFYDPLLAIVTVYIVQCFMPFHLWGVGTREKTSPTPPRRGNWERRATQFWRRSGGRDFFYDKIWGGACPLYCTKPHLHRVVTWLHAFLEYVVLLRAFHIATQKALFF